MTIFVLEGLPGAGKTTVYRKLKDRKRLYIPEAAARFSKKGFKVGKGTTMEEETLLLKENVRRLRLAMKSKRDVVMDRSHISNLAHAEAEGKDLRKMQKLIPKAEWVILFFDVPPIESHRRMKARKMPELETKGGVDYSRKLRKAYLKHLQGNIVIKVDPDNIKHIRSIINSKIDFSAYKGLSGQALALILERMKEKRHSGKPAFTHPIRISEKVKGQEMRCTALLHDIVEDTSTGIAEIRRKFGKQIAKNVDILTKKGMDHEPTVEKRYFHAIKRYPRIQKIKFLDIMDNLETLKYLSRYKQIRFIQRTKRYYLDLAKGKTKERIVYLIDKCSASLKIG